MPSNPTARRLHGALLAALLVLSGCGKDSPPTAPGAGMTQDGADDIALQTVVTFQSTGADMQASRAGWSPVGPAPGMRATGVLLPADTTFKVGEVSFELTRRFYDIDDVELDVYSLLAVKMIATSRAYGTLETARDTAQVGHAASLEVRGLSLLADTLRFNGTSLDTLLNRFRSYDGTRVRHFWWNSALQTSDVLFLKDGSNPYPVSGHLTFTVHADRLRSSDRADVEATLDATVTVTFDGTANPEVVVNGTWHYHWNLLTNALTRA